MKSGNSMKSGNTWKSWNTFEISHLVDFWSCFLQFERDVLDGFTATLKPIPCYKCLQSTLEPFNLIPKITTYDNFIRQSITMLGRKMSNTMEHGHSLLQSDYIEVNKFNHGQSLNRHVILFKLNIHWIVSSIQIAK